MTTILAIQGDGWAAIGSDTQWTDENGRVGKMNQSKVISTGKYLIGVAGDTRGANVIQHVFNPPAVPVKATGVKLTKFIVSQFVPVYREILEAHGIGRPQYDSEPAHTSIETLVLVGGVIYQIDSDYGTEVDANRLYAAGSGAHYGLGALQAFTEKKKMTIPFAKQAILKALSVSAKFDQGTGSPFYTFIQQGA
jgi:ATP-dependent protease HslVU (ClpYQ) peptidase subunit